MKDCRGKRNTETWQWRAKNKPWANNLRMRAKGLRAFPILSDAGPDRIPTGPPAAGIQIG